MVGLGAVSPLFAGSSGVWGEWHRRFRRVWEEHTRYYPNRRHLDTIHVAATYLSPRLIRTEAILWGHKLDQRAELVRKRDKTHRAHGSLRFEVEFSNHRWPRVDQDIQRVLSTACLEIDGRTFAVKEVEPVFFDRMLRGQSRVIRFETPPGEVHLPGPSVRSIRLTFPELESKRRRGARLRAIPRAKWWIPRISFDPDLFGARVAHPTQGS